MTATVSFDGAVIGVLAGEIVVHRNTPILEAPVVIGVIGTTSMTFTLRAVASTLLDADRVVAFEPQHAQPWYRGRARW